MHETRVSSISTDWSIQSISIKSDYRFLSIYRLTTPGTLASMTHYWVEWCGWRKKNNCRGKEMGEGLLLIINLHDLYVKNLWIGTTTNWCLQWTVKVVDNRTCIITLRTSDFDLRHVNDYSWKSFSTRSWRSCSRGSSWNKSSWWINHPGSVQMNFHSRNRLIQSIIY